MRHLLLLVTVCVSIGAFAGDIKWAGMRNPCKISAEDGLNEKQLSRKIGTFITLENKEEWVNAILNVSSRRPTAQPWASWGVGKLKDATALSDEVHHEYLSEMDRQNIEIYLELWPSGMDVQQLIDEALTKFKVHSSVKGISIDLEYYKPKVDDRVAKAWDERIKAHNPKYRLMLKHWEDSHMPPTYRGAGDLIFVNTSSEATMEVLNNEFSAWASKFAPSAVAFQIGYPSDEDGMDGKRTSGWSTLNDPIKDWIDALEPKLKDPKQEVGILWVCAKSGKSYNAQWDLTKKR